MLSAKDVAEYFLYLAENDEDPLTNMKVQKLVYYAQGFCLAISDRPLFEERIEAWVHGPVVPDLYRIYKQYGAGAIPTPGGIDLSQYSPDDKELITEVYSVYGGFTASALRNMTHQEPPWKDTETSEEITHDILKGYFKTRIQ